MAAPVLVSVSWVDVNGLPAGNELYAVDASGALALLPKLKALSNAKILSAHILTPLSLAGVSGNTASAANVETARQKLSITATGPAGTDSAVPALSTIQIPAPIGTLVNGESGDPTNALFTTLLTNWVTGRGETLDTIAKVKYAK